MLGAALGATTSAITGGNIGLGALTGAITGGFLAGASAIVGGAQLTGVCAMGVYTAAGASAGAINAGISGTNPLQGALWGGAFGAAIGAMPSDLGILKPFPKTEWGTVGNRIFGSAVIGAGMGAVQAGMTGGDIGRGAWTGAATWAASQAFLMGAGHIQGRIATGHWYDQFDSGTESWYYYKAGAGAANYGGGVVVGDYTQIWYSPGYPPGFNVWQHEHGHNWQDMFNGPADWLAVSAANSLSVALTAIIGPGYSDAQHSYNPYETTWMPYHAGGL